MNRLLPALARAAAQAQAILDADWNAASTRWAVAAGPLIEATPAAHRNECEAVLGATAPVRQAVARFELDCRVQVVVERGRRTGVAVRPLELGWEAVHGSLAGSAARLVLTVEAVPLAAAGGTADGLSPERDGALDPTRSPRS